MTMKKLIVGLWAFLFTVVLSGCAVLNIEVDVYKGVLANEDDIQTEQIAALAIAAKPLLSQLET